MAELVSLGGVNSSKLSVVWTIEYEGGSEHLGITRFSLAAILLINLSQECGGQFFFFLCVSFFLPLLLWERKKEA